MKAYLAGAFPRRDYIAGIAADLETHGVEVTSRWLRETDSIEAERVHEQAAGFALRDFEDLLRSDTLVVFTEPEGSPYEARSGHHVEFGVALAFSVRSARLGVYRPLRIVVVGTRRNVFHHAAAVEFYETWDTAKASLLQPVEA